MGGHLARQARARWRVVATTFKHDLNLPGCSAVRLDLRNAAEVAALVERLHPRAIIHTAFDMSSPEMMQAVIVEGTAHLATAAATSGARLLYLSSDMVFDGEHAPYSPGDPPQPITPYGRAKAEAERVVAERTPAAAIVRTSLIYGLTPCDPRTLWVLDSLRMRTPITLFSDEIRCPVWVVQLAGALLELASVKEPGIWHLAGPQPVSRYEFGLRLARAFGLDPAGITCGLSRDSGLVRPRDLTMTGGPARATLQPTLWGVDEVLAAIHTGAPRWR